MTAGLTPRMAQCLAAIRNLSADGVSPNYDEIAAEMGLASKSGVTRLVYLLAERGAITCGRQARSIRIVERPRRADLERLSNDELSEVYSDIEDIIWERDSARERAA